MGIRKIETTGMECTGQAKGVSPELRWVSIADLIIDDRYQRSLEAPGRKNIRRIAEGFDWAKFSPLIVSERGDGALAIIDGQHRAHAAALIGITQVPAMVSWLSPREEAEAFSWVNGAVTSLSVNQIFRAALAAFEPWAVQCDAVVGRAGCALMQFNKTSMSREPGEIYCISIIRKHVENGDPEVVYAALKAMRESGETLHEFWSAVVIGVLIEICTELQISNPDVIARFLSRNDLVSMRERAAQVAKDPRINKPGRQVFLSAVRIQIQDQLESEQAA